MGNWQHIPFCVEVVRRIQPRTVLDLSIGQGRWGWTIRDSFASAKDPGAVRVEGVGAATLPDHVRSLYDQVHTSVDAPLKASHDLAILDGVLEPMDKASAIELVTSALRAATYVLVVVRLGPRTLEGADTPGNDSWYEPDFDGLDLIRRCVFRGMDHEAFGCFVLSRQDPRDVGIAMLGADAHYGRGPGRADAVDRVLGLVAEQAFEVSLIKKSRTFRLANKLRRQPLTRLATRAMGKGDPEISVVATGQKNPQSQGSEVWLLSARLNPGEPSFPWEFMSHGRDWHERHQTQGPYGRCLISTRGRLMIPAGTNPELEFLSHPWSGKVRVSFGGRSEEVDLYSEHGARIRIRPTQSPMVQVTRAADEAAADSVATAIPAGPAERTLSSGQEAFVARVRAAKASVVAVHCPRWLGVTNSTKNLFEHLYPVPETPAEEPYHLTDEVLAEYAAALIECGATTIVFSGGDEAHYRLMKILKRAKPNLRFIMLWHGNYVQLSDDYAFNTLKLWIAAAKDGRLASIATVKQGMEQFFASLGARSHFVMNYIKGVTSPSTPPAITAPGTHLGLWMSGTLWKTPNVMLSAAKLIEGAKVHAAGIDPRTKELMEQFHIATGFVSTRPLPFEELMRRIRQTHLTMYVTFTECCPMIPLESFSQGVPAIVGPSSHLFLDEDYLSRRLVVPFPDRADAIADTIRGALEERDAIVARYAAYAPGYNERARQSVERLLA